MAAWRLATPERPVLADALAEFERDLIRERTHAGLAAARARGRVGGHPKKLAAPQQLALARALSAGGQTDVATICAVETLKFLSDRNRLRILSTRAHAETCVCDLIDALALLQPLVSYHLRKLRDAGLVQTRSKAQWMYYSLDPEVWRTLVARLGGLFPLGPLPPAAAYGASHRCDVVPPDPAHGAGCDD
jgi:ArsR family transcriptional regulator